VRVSPSGYVADRHSSSRACSTTVLADKVASGFDLSSMTGLHRAPQRLRQPIVEACFSSARVRVVSSTAAFRQWCDTAALALVATYR
jgi:hypothetical protein